MSALHEEDGALWPVHHPSSHLGRAGSDCQGTGWFWASLLPPAGFHYAILMLCPAFLRCSWATVGKEMSTGAEHFFPFLIFHIVTF